MWSKDAPVERGGALLTQCFGKEIQSVPERHATCSRDEHVASVQYQDVSVPASQWFTTYWWRFGTWSGGAGSGFTGWSSFYRSF